MPALPTLAGETVKLKPDSLMVSYIFAITGALAVGANNSDWVDVSQISELLVQANITNGTGATTLFVEQSNDQLAGSSKRVDHTSADLTGTANSKVNLGYQFARLRAQQATAVSTGGTITAKASD